MLRVGGLPPPSSPPYSKPSVAKPFPLLSIHICTIHLSASPISPLSLGRSELRLFAQKNNHGNGATVAVDSRKGFKEEEEIEYGHDDFEFDFEDDDDDYEDEDAEKDDELDVIVPIDELDDWLKRSKPRGFGEEKVYDTSIEDELLEEIEQSRRAQIANINKLKSLSLDPSKHLNKDGEGVSSGACVRISNLPRKKNIHRDLKTAFKGISGIVDITPLNLGNKKTKEPICKGLAFVNFKSSEDAKRFIDIFSVQSITFGKIDKQIKCELMNSIYNANHKTRDRPNVGKGQTKADLDDVSGFLHLNDEDDDYSSDEDVDLRDRSKSLSASKLDDIDQIEQKIVVSLASKRGDNPKAAVKVKPSPKKTVKKNTIVKIPGAAKRLKLREKTMLEDVFSKYASKIASTKES